jgi:hypothetical protein
MIPLLANEAPAGRGLAMKMTRLMLAGLSGAVVASGLTLGVQALATGTSATYYACLKAGILSKVGTTTPTCGKGSKVISWNSQGPAGPKGQKGSTGPSGQGPSYYAVAPAAGYPADPHYGQDDANYSDVDSVSVPAGDYLASANVDLPEVDGVYVSCFLEGGSSKGDLLSIQLNFNVVLPVSAEIAMPTSGSISVECDSASGWATNETKITALAVSAIH